MATTRFQFPQEQATFEEHICNSSASGAFELLHVTGLVRLEATGGRAGVHIGAGHSSASPIGRSPHIVLARTPCRVGTAAACAWAGHPREVCRNDDGGTAWNAAGTKVKEELAAAAEAGRKRKAEEEAERKERFNKMAQKWEEEEAALRQAYEAAGAAEATAGAAPANTAELPADAAGSETTTESEMMMVVEQEEGRPAADVEPTAVVTPASPT